jgi:hypothetical protein
MAQKNFQKMSSQVAFPATTIATKITIEFLKFQMSQLMLFQATLHLQLFSTFRTFKGLTFGMARFVTS